MPLVKVTVQVGSVVVQVRGLDMTVKDVRNLLRHAASIALAVDATPEEPERAPLGFSAPVLERLPDELSEPD